MGLFDAKYRTRFSLRETAIFDDTVGLQRKMNLRDDQCCRPDL